MPHISELHESKYLAKQDAKGPGILVTITGLTKENVAMEGQPAEMKPCLKFAETPKLMVMSQTNLQLCALALGSEMTEDWMGKKVVVFVDPSIMFQGRLVGGLRIRAPKGRAAAAPAAPTPIPAPAAMPPLPDEPGADDADPF